MIFISLYMILQYFSIENFIHTLNLNFNIAQLFFFGKEFHYIGLNILVKAGINFLIYETNITTISNKRYMTYECYIKQPMQMDEMNLNLMI